MTIVLCCGLVEAVKRPQCIACCNCSCVVGCASPLPDHCVEKAWLNDPNILSCVKGEKKGLMVVGHVTRDEKYECVMLNVVIRWFRIGVGSVY